VVEVFHALRLSRLNNAILSTVELIVLWVNGKLGAHAPRHAVAAFNPEPAELSLLLLVVVPLVPKPPTPFLATHNLVPIIKVLKVRKKVAG
jgi:hypothetical protein